MLQDYIARKKEIPFLFGIDIDVNKSLTSEIIQDSIEIDDIVLILETIKSKKIELKDNIKDIYELNKILDLLDIKISDDNIEYESIDIETDKINVVKKTYLENKIRNYIDDCEELKKEYKTCPGYDELLFNSLFSGTYCLL